MKTLTVWIVVRPVLSTRHLIRQLLYKTQFTWSKFVKVTVITVYILQWSVLREIVTDIEIAQC